MSRLLQIMKNILRLTKPQPAADARALPGMQVARPIVGLVTVAFVGTPSAKPADAVVG